MRFIIFQNLIKIDLIIYMMSIQFRFIQTPLTIRRRTQHSWLVSGLTMKDLAETSSEGWMVQASSTKKRIPASSTKKRIPASSTKKRIPVSHIRTPLSMYRRVMLIVVLQLVECFPPKPGGCSLLVTSMYYFK